MRAIGMLPATYADQAAHRSVVAESSTWVRASDQRRAARSRAGRNQRRQGTLLGTISDPFGQEEAGVHSPVRGIVIGRLKLPLVYQGDALFHVACLDDDVQSAIETQQELQPGDWSEPL